MGACCGGMKPGHHQKSLPEKRKGESHEDAVQNGADGKEPVEVAALVTVPDDTTPSEPAVLNHTDQVPPVSSSETDLRVTADSAAAWAAAFDAVEATEVQQTLPDTESSMPAMKVALSCSKAPTLEISQEEPEVPQVTTGVNAAALISTDISAESAELLVAEGFEIVQKPTAGEDKLFVSEEGDVTKVNAQLEAASVPEKVQDLAGGELETSVVPPESMTQWAAAFESTGSEQLPVVEDAPGLTQVSEMTGVDQVIISEQVLTVETKLVCAESANDAIPAVEEQLDTGVVPEPIELEKSSGAAVDEPAQISQPTAATEQEPAVNDSALEVVTSEISIVTEFEAEKPPVVQEQPQLEESAILPSEEVDTFSHEPASETENIGEPLMELQASQQTQIELQQTSAGETTDIAEPLPDQLQQTTTGPSDDLVPQQEAELASHELVCETNVADASAEVAVPVKEQEPDVELISREPEIAVEVKEAVPEQSVVDEMPTEQRASNEEAAGLVAEQLPVPSVVAVDHESAVEQSSQQVAETVTEEPSKPAEESVLEFPPQAEVSAETTTTVVEVPEPEHVPVLEETPVLEQPPVDQPISEDQQSSQQVAETVTEEPSKPSEESVLEFPPQPEVAAETTTTVVEVPEPEHVPVLEETPVLEQSPVDQPISEDQQSSQQVAETVTEEPSKPAEESVLEFPPQAEVSAETTTTVVEVPEPEYVPILEETPVLEQPPVDQPISEDQQSSQQVAETVTEEPSKPAEESVLEFPPQAEVSAEHTTTVLEVPEPQLAPVLETPVVEQPPIEEPISEDQPKPAVEIPLEPSPPEESDTAISVTDVQDQAPAFCEPSVGEQPSQPEEETTSEDQPKPVEEFPQPDVAESSVVDVQEGSVPSNEQLQQPDTTSSLSQETEILPEQPFEEPVAVKCTLYAPETQTDPETLTSAEQQLPEVAAPSEPLPEVNEATATDTTATLAHEEKTNADQAVLVVNTEVEEQPAQECETKEPIASDVTESLMESQTTEEAGVVQPAVEDGLTGVENNVAASEQQPSVDMQTQQLDTAVTEASFDTAPTTVEQQDLQTTDADDTAVVDEFPPPPPPAADDQFLESEIAVCPPAPPSDATESFDTTVDGLPTSVLAGDFSPVEFSTEKANTDKEPTERPLETPITAEA